MLQLVYAPGYSQALIELENYINSGKITLLTHKVILEEWKRHKDDDKERKTRKLLGSPKSKDNSKSEIIPSQLPITTAHINLQFELVDKLLENATVLTTPQAINHEVAERIREKKAPFHIKQISLNDWEIIGSAALYCEHNNIPILNFISFNHTDFAIDSEDGYVIHHDFANRFDKVKINYYKEIQHFITDVKNHLIPEHFLTGKIIRNEKYSYKSSVKLNDLDSLYYLFKDIFEDISFIPLHQLAKYHPFSKPGNVYTYYTQFEIDNVRDELVEFFENIKIDNSLSFELIDGSLLVNIKDSKEKINYVLKRLTSNLVFNLRAEKSRRVANIHFNPATNCQCFKCCFAKFDIVATISGLSQPVESIPESMMKAYYNYKLGNYSSAIGIYQETMARAESEKSFFFYFLCKYNLRHLGKLIDSPFSASDLSNECISDLKMIDPIEECVKLKSAGNYDLMEWIASGAFFHETFDTIVEKVGEIEDHYDSFLKGGWSSNSHVFKLVQEFAVLDSFINNNGVIYDAYNNFDRLFTHVIKGLFASHAMRGTDNSSLEIFDDYWVSRFILYGNKKMLFKYFNKYKLKELSYKSTNANGNNFLLIAKGVFASEKSTRKAVNSYKDASNYHFGDFYAKTFDNILALGTMLSLHPKEVNQFAKALLSFLKTEKSLNYFNYESISSFVHQRGKLFDDGLRDQYMEHFLENSSKYDFGVLKEITSSYPNRRMPSKHSNAILTKIFDREARVNQMLVYDFLAALVRKVDDTTQLMQSVNEMLTHNFNFELYYHALIYDVLPFEKKKLFKLIDEIDLTKKQYHFKTVRMNKHANFIYRLDQLINIIFKFDIVTQDKRFERFRSYSNYYSWVLDMENFDYEKFDIHWIAHYPTKFYFKAMSKSKSLKRFVIRYLNNQPDPSVVYYLTSFLTYDFN